MKQVLIIALVAILSGTPTAAQDNQPIPEETAPTDGADLMAQGMQLFLQGLLGELDPTLKELRDLADEVDPKLKELYGLIGDLNQYKAPEILPNGDIIIRKKTPAEMQGDEENPDSEIDL